ncbi:MAG: hypothetical protein MZV65_28445 [Chromatiales bacterium]|nr:hypothetical protein [Chromatiales bacterium]
MSRSRPANGQLVTPDVDIQGDGGYVILPGSVMLDGSSYGWEGSTIPMRARCWPMRPTGWCRWWWSRPIPRPPARLVSRPIRSARGDAMTGSTAWAARSEPRGWASAIVAALLAENTERCDPPLPETSARYGPRRGQQAAGPVAGVRAAKPSAPNALAIGHHRSVIGAPGDAPPKG